MKFLFEMFPIVAFFGAYFGFGRDFYMATIVLMVAVALQIVMLLVARKPVSNMLKISAALIFVLGTVTIFFQNPLFLKWKPTVLYWIFALMMIGSIYVGEKPVMQRLMGKDLALDRHVWSRLTVGWGSFFALFGFANLYVAYRFEEATWVKFKLFGFFGMIIIMSVATAFWISRYLPDEEGS